jgi:hypothetical protein
MDPIRSPNGLTPELARIKSARRFLHPFGTVLIFYIWLAYQVSPLFLALSRTRPAEKFRIRFADASISPLETFTHFVEGLIVVQLLEGAGHRVDPPLVPATSARPSGQTIYRGQDRHLVRIGWRGAGVYLLVSPERISRS